MFRDWLGNYPLTAALLAILLAQAFKIPLHYLFHRKWEWRKLWSPGGMPSSHSAAVTALAAAIGYRDGLLSTTFAISCVLGVIVMYDAMGIRRHAGEQAIEINRLKEAFDKHLETDDPVFSRERLRHQTKHLKEILGHQPIEVVGGAAFGVACGLLLHLFYL